MRSEWSYLLAPGLAWTIAQVSKVILTSVRQRRLNLRVLAETFFSEHE